MVDWNSLLNTKYAIMQQNADTNRISAQASANLQNANAAEVAPNAISQRTAQAAQTGLVDQQRQYFGQEAKARIGGLLANTDLDKARTNSITTLLPGQVAAQTASTRQTNASAAASEFATDYAQREPNAGILGLLGFRGQNYTGLPDYLSKFLDRYRIGSTP